MPTENVVHSIRQARETTAAERNRVMLELESFQHSLEAAAENLRKARSRQDSLLAAEREIARKHRELVDYCYSLEDCPAALSAEIERLAAEKSYSAIKRKPADEAVAKCEKALADRRSELEAAAQNFQRLDQQVKELDIHMAKLN